MTISSSVCVTLKPLSACDSIGSGVRAQLGQPPHQPAGQASAPTLAGRRRAPVTKWSGPLGRLPGAHGFRISSIAPSLHSARPRLEPWPESPPSRVSYLSSAPERGGRSKRAWTGPAWRRRWPRRGASRRCSRSAAIWYLYFVVSAANSSLRAGEGMIEYEPHYKARQGSPSVLSGAP